MPNGVVAPAVLGVGLEAVDCIMWPDGKYARCRVDWTSDADGKVDQVIVKAGRNSELGSPQWFDGDLIRVDVFPAGGGDAPSDGYDLGLLDRNGHDVLEGAGTARSSTEPQAIAPCQVAPASPDDLVRPVSFPDPTTLSLVINNAGSGKKGSVVIYLSRD